MKKLLLVLSLLLMLPMGVFGEDDGPSGEVIIITTDDALELALSNNLDIQAGLAALETARTRVKSADNRWTPMLTSSYSYTRLADIPTISVPGEGDEMIEFPMGTYDNYMLGLQFIWPVYSGGEKQANISIAELGVEGLEAQQQVLEDITGVLAQHYCLNLRQARGQIVARRKSLEYISGLLKTSEALFEQGIIPKNDLLRVQVQKTNSEQELALALNNERLAQDQLNAFIGFDFGTQLEIEVLGYEPFFFEADLEPFYQLALRQRPEMEAMSLQYEILEKERKMSKSGRLPDVSLVVSFERSGDNPLLSANGISEPNSISATVQVTYDLYDGGEVSDFLAELDSRELELDVMKKQIEQSIYLELEEAYLNVKQAYGDILAMAKAITQAEENLRITRRRFEEGLVVANNVIEAEALLLSAQLSNTFATYNYYRAAAFVGKAVGVADMNYYLELRDTLGLEDGSDEDE